MSGRTVGRRNGAVTHNARRWVRVPHEVEWVQALERYHLWLKQHLPLLRRAVV